MALYHILHVSKVLVYLYIIVTNINRTIRQALTTFAKPGTYGCGILPQGTPVGEMPGTGLPCCEPQCREAAGKFHVQALPVSGSGGPGGTVSGSSLKYVWNAYSSRAAHQAPPDGKMRPEYADEVEETGCVDSVK